MRTRGLRAVCQDAGSARSSLSKLRPTQARTWQTCHSYRADRASVVRKHAVPAVSGACVGERPTRASCTSSGKDRHRFREYGVALPTGASIKGIEVRLDAQADSTSGTRRMCVQLSWNGGLSWTSAKTTSALTTSEATYVLGGTVRTLRYQRPALPRAWDG